jgi:hypothetical protein
VARVKVSSTPRELAQLGQLEAVVYSTRKHGARHAHYEHQFGETGKRKPTLAMDPRTKRLHVVGGAYTVTGRGIED